MNKMDANEIISFIANSKKSTPVKVYIKGDLEGIDFGQSKLSLTEILELYSVSGMKSKQLLRPLEAKLRIM